MKSLLQIDFWPIPKGKHSTLLSIYFLKKKWWFSLNFQITLGKTGKSKKNSKSIQAKTNPSKATNANFLGLKNLFNST
jgi:hypothetical protein